MQGLQAEQGQHPDPLARELRHRSQLRPPQGSGTLCQTSSGSGPQGCGQSHQAGH